MGKKSKPTIDLDVAKAVWQKYADIIKERWTRDLALAVASEDMEAVRAVGKSMESFSFDFNIASKEANQTAKFGADCKWRKFGTDECSHRHSELGKCNGKECALNLAAERGEVL